PDQVRAGVAHLGPGVGADGVPPQPGLLDHVLGVGGRAEQLVGDGEEQPPVSDERVLGGAHDLTAGWARGRRPQAAANPSDSMPRATLPRVVALAKATTAVSSTRAASPSWVRRDATMASV